MNSIKDITAITTVGTSLLTNANKFLGSKYKDLTKIDTHEIWNFIKTKKRENKEKEISAEINSTLQLREYLRTKENKNLRTVHLVLSGTEEMEKILPILKEFFEDEGFNVRNSTVSSLKYKESRFKMEGLRELITELSNIIRQYGKDNVVMNATGGFKAEIAYATVLSQLMHIEAFYIYESFNEIIPLPYLPLILDYEYWHKYFDIFDRYVEGVSNNENDNLLKRAPKGFKYLIFYNEKNNKWELNPAGYAFYESLMQEEEIYLREIDQRKVFIRRGESTLWLVARNKNVSCLDDIPDDDVKNLLKRVIKFPFVNKIELVDYHEVGRSQGETRLEYRTKNCNDIPNYVQYSIKCKDGVQNINIIVEKGRCEDLIFMLGKKVFP